MSTQNSGGIFNQQAYGYGNDPRMYLNPFCDIASNYIPINLNEVFNWCEYLYLAVVPFASVSQRVVRYFLTEVVVEAADDKEREKYEKFLNQKLHLIQRLAEIGDDYQVYGNVFISIYFPFDRYLACPKCGVQYHISTIDSYKFDPKTLEISAKCGKCGYDGPMNRIDRKSSDLDRVRLIRWDPKFMKLRVHPITGRIKYYTRLPEKLVQKVNEGDPFYFNETPWEVVRACADASKGEETLFQFNDDAILHFKNSTLAGLPIKGWGIPPILPNFKLAYYTQLLRRFDEAIAMDFIMPFRVLYPTAAGGQDALSTMSMQTFKAAMEQMVEQQRKNLRTVQVAPFPIGYQMLGGEAQQLAPKDSLQQAISELLASMGYPQELYAGTLTLQAAPVALRLFEKQFNVMVDGFNDIVEWVLLRCSNYFQWGDVTGYLRSITLADDLERKGLQLQAAAGMDISKQTAYRPLGIDYMAEQKRVVEEQKAIQKLQQEAMEEQQAQQSNEAMGGGEGSDQGPGGAPGATPGDVYEQAHQIAEQLINQTPPTMVRGELIKIKQSNPTLHALVKQFMSEIRQQAASQGRAMVLEQQRQEKAGAAKDVDEEGRMRDPATGQFESSGDRMSDIMDRMGEIGDLFGDGPGDDGFMDMARSIAESVMDMPDRKRRENLRSLKRHSLCTHVMVVSEIGRLKDGLFRRSVTMTMKSAAALPSPFKIGLEVVDQMTSYTRKDFRKLACQAVAGVPHAREAFHALYSYVLDNSGTSFPEVRS